MRLYFEYNHVRLYTRTSIHIVHTPHSTLLIMVYEYKEYTVSTEIPICVTPVSWTSKSISSSFSFTCAFSCSTSERCASRKRAISGGRGTGVGGSAKAASLAAFGREVESALLARSGPSCSKYSIARLPRRHCSRCCFSSSEAASVQWPQVPVLQLKA